MSPFALVQLALTIRVRFGPLPMAEVEKRLNHVVKAEKYVSSQYAIFVLTASG